MLAWSLRAGEGSSAAGRAGFDAAAAPVASAWAAPFRALGGAGDGIAAYIDAGSQNAALRRELIVMRGWRDTALGLAQENARLRSLLEVRTDPPIPLVAARTILESRGPFSQSRLADVGADRGVGEGNPALSEHGLIGRVTGVAAHACRILLLTDPVSRVPVLLPRVNGRAILAGDGGPNPSLQFLRAHLGLRLGDRVLTSGDGGVFPRGLAVGEVVRGLDGAWRVALDSDAAPIDFVDILLFTSFAQVAPPAAGPLPSPATEPPAAPPAVATTPAQARDARQAPRRRSPRRRLPDGETPPHRAAQPPRLAAGRPRRSPCWQASPSPRRRACLASPSPSRCSPARRPSPGR